LIVQAGYEAQKLRTGELLINEGTVGDEPELALRGDRLSGQIDAAFTCAAPVGYNILSGGGSTFQQDESGPASLTITASGDIHKFTGLMLNGEPVNESDYDVLEGSTIVTLHQDFLKTLQPGAYTLRFQYTDGFAEAGFTVQDQMPATGDNDTLLLFGILTALSLAAIILLKRKAARL
jgi:LPXTG-motif cell wall-anchored protein